jgi:hypothetical protein
MDIVRLEMRGIFYITTSISTTYDSPGTIKKSWPRHY